MEQTATTQLYLKLQQIEFYYQQGDLTITEFIEAKKEAFSQAEKTFKQQIIDANSVGYKYGVHYINGQLWEYKTPYNYYNEIYGTENEK